MKLLYAALILVLHLHLIHGQAVGPQSTTGGNLQPCRPDFTEESKLAHLKAFNDAFQGHEIIDHIFLLDNSKSLRDLFQSSKNFLNETFLPFLYEYKKLMLATDNTRVLLQTIGGSNKVNLSNLLNGQASISYCDLTATIDDIYTNKVWDSVGLMLDGVLEQIIDLYHSQGVRSSPPTVRVLWIVSNGRDLSVEQYQNITRYLTLLKQEFGFTVLIVAPHQTNIVSLFDSNDELRMRQWATSENHFACMGNWEYYMYLEIQGIDPNSDCWFATTPATSRRPTTIIGPPGPTGFTSHTTLRYTNTATALTRITRMPTTTPETTSSDTTSMFSHTSTFMTSRPSCLPDRTELSASYHIGALDSAFRDQKEIDLIVLLDRSSNLPELLNSSKEFLSNSLLPFLLDEYKNFNFSPDGGRIRLTTSDDNGVTEFSSLLEGEDDLTSYCNITARINAMNFSVGSYEKTNLDRALVQILTLYSGRYVRSSPPTSRVLWILTDGRDLNSIELRNIGFYLSLVQRDLHFTVFTVAVQRNRVASWIQEEDELLLNLWATTANHYACLENWEYYLKSQGRDSGTSLRGRPVDCEVLQYPLGGEKHPHSWYQLIIGLVVGVAALLFMIAHVAVILAIVRHRRRQRAQSGLIPPPIQNVYEEEGHYSKAIAHMDYAGSADGVKVINGISKSPGCSSGFDSPSGPNSSLYEGRSGYFHQAYMDYTGPDRDSVISGGGVAQERLKPEVDTSANSTHSASTEAITSHKPQNR